MIDAIRARPILTSIGLLLLLILVLSAFPIVPETKQAVVVRFNNPVRILNQYEPGRPIGAAGAGISWRIPIAEQPVWIDKRVQDVDMQRQQVISTDQRRLEVDAFAREQEAQSILAQGARQAQVIQAEADAEAAQTYAASFGKDPQFYDFYRAMQSYRTTFLGDKVAPTTLVLSPQNDYLKEFTGRN